MDFHYSWIRVTPMILLTIRDPFTTGTGVFGVIVGDNDTKGVTGISWGSTIGLAPAQTGTGA